MKKFTIEDSLNWMIIVLILLTFAIFIEYIYSKFTGNQPNYVIQAQMISIVSAISTIILVFITAGYAKSTKELLDEQIKLRKIASIEKVLENVYSPMNNAFNEFRENTSLQTNRIPDNFVGEFNTLYFNFNKIDTKYHHLIDKEIINATFEMWDLSNQFEHERNLAKYHLLNSKINELNSLILYKIDEKKSLLESLQA